MFRNNSAEYKLLEECEQSAHTALVAKGRFLEFSKIIPKIPPPSRILDIGGTLGTAQWLSVKFPNASITILNNSKQERSLFGHYLIANAQNFSVKKPYDLIFCGETIEHVYNPDGLLYSCYHALNQNGYFVLSTPNLSCLYDRIFLLLGWSTGNYMPSLRFITGNPLINRRTVNFGMIGDHKSVFTQRGLKELLGMHGFKAIWVKGFSYGQNKPYKNLGNRFYQTPFGSFRNYLNKILPHGLREGMLFVCRKIGTPVSETHNSIIKKNIWEI